VTGFQTAEHAPVHLEVPAVSGVNRYTVSRLEPEARIVPSLALCLVVMRAAGATVDVPPLL
jgi:DNA-binding XRE family transcriptional regulator